MTAVQVYESADFNRFPGRAKKAATKETVVVTNHGKTTHILLGVSDEREREELIAIIDQYRSRKENPKRSILDLISMVEGADIEFQPERLGVIAREVNFS